MHYKKKSLKIYFQDSLSNNKIGVEYVCTPCSHLPKIIKRKFKYVYSTHYMHASTVLYNTAERKHGPQMPT